MSVPDVPMKYSGSRGLMNNTMTSVLSIHPKLRADFVKYMNSSNADASWQQMSSVLKIIKKLQDKYQVDLTLPWAENNMINFCLLLAKEGRMPATINVYVSRVRLWHRLEGIITLNCVN